MGIIAVEPELIAVSPGRDQHQAPVVAELRTAAIRGFACRPCRCACEFPSKFRTRVPFAIEPKQSPSADDSWVTGVTASP